MCAGKSNFRSADVKMRMASHATAFAYSPPSLAYSVLFQSVSCICIPAMPAFIANQASGCAAPATLGTGWYAFHALDCRGFQICASSLATSAKMLQYLCVQGCYCKNPSAINQHDGA
mmetsp:Transcript_23959/g.54920  ORF Transcript_23959/g.54920 Transcript_23959/m.54920 type:complete len:117 (+) Transcript_23959:319-669(+)